MTLEISREDGVVVLTLARPDVLNVIDTAMADALTAALDEAAADDSLAVVITGAGRAFCAGTDLRERDVDILEKLHKMHLLVQRLVKFPKLTVAALNGMALGGGLELALGCAMRVAGPAVKLGLPEIKIAAMPCYGATHLLPRLIGVSRALSMMLTGEPMDSAEALSIGLVAVLDDDPRARSIALAVRCSSGRQAALRAIRRSVHEGAMMDLEQGLALERQLALELSDGSEIREAIAAFFARKQG